MSGFEIFLDLIVITVGFLLVGRDRNAQPVQVAEVEIEPTIDAKALVEEAIAAMPTALVAGSLTVHEVLSFPSKQAAVAPTQKKRGRPKKTTAATTPVTTEKRKRGRPRKEVAQAISG